MKSPVKLPKRLLSGLLAAAFVTGACSIGAGYQVAAENESGTVFDESNVVLSFSTLSDTHVQGSADHDSTQKFRKALAQLQTRAKNDNHTLDAIVIDGDITDYGTKEQIQLVNDALQARIKEGLDLNATKLLLSMGNHELYDAELNHGDQGVGLPTQAEAKPHFHGATTYKEILGDKMYTGNNTAEQLEIGFLHSVINGYHFINFSLFDYNHGLRYDPKELEWLKEALAQAKQDDPNKPIFFAMHAMVKGTTLGSNYGDYWAVDNKEFYDTLAQYPQLVTFGAHLHFPLQDDRSIFQKDFTSIETGSVYYASLESASTNPKTGETMKFQDISGSEPADAANFSQGLYIQIDKNNNIRVTRMDFKNKAEIKEPWVIPAPNAENHLKMYTAEAHEVGNTAPQFASGAKVTVKPYDKVADPNHLTVTFDTAKDNDMVLCYEIRYINKANDSIINKVYKYSDYYLHPKPVEMSASWEFKGEKRSIYPMKPNYPDDYYVEVRAIDCYGLVSAPISSEVVAGDPSGAVEVPEPSLDPQDTWKFKPFTTFDYLKAGYTPTKGTDFDGWPTADAPEFHPYQPTANNGFNNSPAITKKVNGAANAYDVWSLNGSEEEYAKAFNTNFDGAVEFWAWVDFSQVHFDAFYFGFRNQVFYGGDDEFITEVGSSVEGMHFYIQDDKGGWIEKTFNTDGTMDIGGYKGFIRFAVEDFVNKSQTPMYPMGLKTLKFWYSLANDQDYTGKTFTIDQVGFAGPSVEGATMTVGEMKAQDGSAKVTFSELTAACTGAKKTFDAGKKSYTDATWAAFTKAYTDASTLPANATSAQIEAAYAALKAAQNALSEGTTPSTSDTSSTQSTTTTGSGSTVPDTTSTETSSTDVSATTSTSETTSSSTTKTSSPVTGDTLPLAAGGIALLAITSCGILSYKKKG